jgi:allantoicase
LLPGRAENQAGGWETRRKRVPGHDWIIVQLGARGTPQLIEVDTHHFKGNFPERCSIDGLNVPAGTRITDLIASMHWAPVLEVARLSADTRHFFSRLRESAVVSHLRLNIYPDGGVSRLRVWGQRDG